jgi:ribonuclease HI
VKQLRLFESDNPAPHPTQTDIAQQQKVEWRLYVDGASRNNPGPSGAGVYLLKNNTVIEKQGYFLGIKTNNEAEYLALILGMLLVRQFARPTDEIFVISDSQLLIRQLQGTYRVRTETLKKLHMVAHGLVVSANAGTMHVLRAENSEADKLANLGIDTQREIPAEFLLTLKQHGIHV